MLNFTMQQSVYQIQNKSQYKHQGVNRSKKTTTTTTTKSASVVYGNVLEASLTNCVDQTVPDVEESDQGPHDLPVCLYADVVLHVCVFYIRGSRNLRQGGGRGEGGEGVQAEKKLHCLEKNSGKLFFCF